MDLEKDLIILEEDAKYAWDVIAGFVMTTAMIITIPVLIDTYLEPLLAKSLGNAEYGLLTSDVIVVIAILVMIMTYVVVLGETTILATHGLLGVLGMILAYVILGKYTDMIVPVVTVTVVWVYIHRKHRKPKEEPPGG